MPGGRPPRRRHALVVGRFQPLHKGHEALIRQALAECGRVTVGVGSSQVSGTWQDPFSADERTDMVRAVFGAAADIAWIPDLGDPPRWVDHVRRIVPGFDVVYGNDDATMRLFEDGGVATVRPGLVERSLWEATTLRRLMADDEPAWQDAVPPAVVAVVEKIEGQERLRALAPHGR